MNVPANPEGNPGPEPQQVQMSTATARVPGQVGDGVFSTGTIVMTGPNEFVVDFVQQMGQPSRVVSRVVIPLAVMPQFITALEQNLVKFEQQFGAPPKVPQPENPKKRKMVRKPENSIFQKTTLLKVLNPGDISKFLI